MLFFLLAIAAAPPSDPTVVDAITREITQRMSDDRRLDVKNEGDVKLLFDMEGRRQECGAQACDVSKEIAAALGARVVVVSHINQLDDILILDISFYDATETRFHRAQVRGETTRQLFEQIPSEMQKLLAAITGAPSDGSTVAFVLNTQTDQVVVAPSAVGPSTLTVVGGVGAGLGTAALLTGAGIYAYAFSENGRSEDERLDDVERVRASNTARSLEVPSIVLFAAGAFVAVAGTVLFFVAE